jgi:hypothetical protein
MSRAASRPIKEGKKMRNKTTIVLRAMTRWLVRFVEVRLPMDVSWNCRAALSPQREIAPHESGLDEAGPDEIELSHATAMMRLCGSCSRC